MTAPLCVDVVELLAGAEERMYTTPTHGTHGPHGF